MGYKYKVFGLVFDSEVEFPGLYTSDEPTDITIALGKLPDTLGDNSNKKIFYETLDNRFLLKLDRIGKIYTENGEKIIIDMNGNPSVNELRLYLFGSVIGAVAHQRKLLPLHTSAINYGGNAILFGGNSGAGKSSIVAELNKRGYSIIGDDTILVNKDGEGNFFTYHGAPEIKLWQDVSKDAEHLGNIREQILDKEKYRYNLIVDDNERKYPIVRLYNIVPIADKELEINEVKPLQKVKIIKNITYRLRIAYVTGNKINHFKQAAEFAQKISIKSITRPREFIKPSVITDLILDDLEKDYGKS